MRQENERLHGNEKCAGALEEDDRAGLKRMRREVFPSWGESRMDLGRGAVVGGFVNTCRVLLASLEGLRVT